MKLSVRTRPAAPEPVEPQRPASVSPDELMRLTEQRLALSLEERPITPADLDMNGRLVPQIREILARR